MRRANLYVAEPRVALGPSWPWDVSSHFCFSSCFKTFIWPAGAPTSAKAAQYVWFSLPLLGGQNIYDKGGSGRRSTHATLRWHHTISVTPREDCWGGVNRIPASVDDLSVRPATSVWKVAACWPFEFAFRGTWGMSWCHDAPVHSHFTNMHLRRIHFLWDLFLHTANSWNFPKFPLVVLQIIKTENILFLCVLKDLVEQPSLTKCCVNNVLSHFVCYQNAFLAFCVIILTPSCNFSWWKVSGGLCFIRLVWYYTASFYSFTSGSASDGSGESETKQWKPKTKLRAEEKCRVEW